ncbi:hypothetical protein HFN60_30920 [Rhizobium leguminosarum]|uniref:hypothetical protein n=1 Tax=Rhizobium leguminosarum TaxID=384 RepID=UPI001C94D1D3|nr:hypothetical protein [Rhizobium leguminosarum]MBY5820006.1 hypothetical protein [Rhizobium leguminosarum]
MTVRMLRIVARCSADLDYPMYIDAPVDDAGMIVTKGWMFGVMGKTLGDRLNPFIGRLDKDEPSPRFPFLLDFGTDFDDPSRFYWTNLTLKRVRKGEQFTIRMPAESEVKGFGECVYEIREMVDLAQQQQIDVV